MMRAVEQRGFTIIEALVAILILAIAATAIIETFAAGARLSGQRAVRYGHFDEAQNRLAIVRAEVAAWQTPFDRQVNEGERIIRETARPVASAEAAGSPASLFEITVSIGLAESADRRVVTLTDYLIVGIPR